MLDRFFRLSENGTNIRTELLAGVTTFLTMAYIIFLQPAVLSGNLFGRPNGMDAGSVMTATCLAAALATVVMGLYARYPIAQAPGMGENFFFALFVVPAAAAMIADRVEAGQMAQGDTTPWQVALGVVFIAGVLFLALSLLGVRKMILDAVSSNLRHAIAVGIGLFIAFIGLKNAGLVVADPVQCVRLNARFGSPDTLVFFTGLTVTVALHARRVRGSIIWGIGASTLLSIVLLYALPAPETNGDADEPTAASVSGLFTHFAEAEKIAREVGPVSTPPSIAPTFLKMDLVRALAPPMLPFILVFLFMDLFDTLGTLIGVSERAGLMKNGKLPRAQQAMLSDAVGTVAGAALGTSTVTSFIESTAGVEQGGRTGLTALTTAALFLVALFFSPLIALVGSYAPITAAALVVVGAMMMASVKRIDWDDFTEAVPAFLIVIGIPLTFSIADGLALGFLSYPVVKLLAGRSRDVKWPMYVLAAVLVAYFLLVRARTG